MSQTGGHTDGLTDGRLNVAIAHSALRRNYIITITRSSTTRCLNKKDPLCLRS